MELLQMKKMIFLFTLVSMLLIACKKGNEEIKIQYIFDFELTVVDMAGEPLAGISVDLYAQYSNEKFVSTDLTGDDGKILYKSLNIGKYSAYLSIIPGYVSASEEIVVRTTGDHKGCVTIQNKLENNSSPIIITGIMSDPRGSDSAAAGTSSSYPGTTGNTVLHAGGYEYIQLIALENIDFGETPFSVVTCNGEPTSEGWAAGGTTSFKFNLTSGKVSKGSFFYVGGQSKVIAGYGNCGKSTDIKDARWIRTIDYKTSGGDGLGDKSNGILGNASTEGSNISDGIAVFSGTEISQYSVPVDAVFYGTIVAFLDMENSTGYRIPQNDHYNPVNPVNGEPQPFFGQGTNTYLFGQPAVDAGEFNQLGGVISQNKWLAPRESTLKSLSYCPDASNLSDIEMGIGVTQFVNN